MKRILVAALLLVMLAGLAFGQEAKRPTAAVSFELFGSVLALMGANAEFFLGPVGLSGEVRFLFFSYGGNFLGFVEPGAAVRFYFSELESSMFLMGGVSYLTAFGLGSGGAGVTNVGLLKPKAGVGYNVLFGKGNKTRFAIELGAVYMVPVVAGDAIPSSDLFPILPHLLIMFGRVF